MQIGSVPSLSRALSYMHFYYTRLNQQKEKKRDDEAPITVERDFVAFVLTFRKGDALKNDNKTD